MGPVVEVQNVSPRLLAAIRREVIPGAGGLPWRPALDAVWKFIRAEDGLWQGGHNVFLYHHPRTRGRALLCDFGVEVTRPFDRSGEVYATATPTGEAAVAIHRGPYDRMRETHTTIAEWMTASGRESGGQSWEVYGDPTPNPDEAEVEIYYLLR